MYKNGVGVICGAGQIMWSRLYNRYKFWVDSNINPNPDIILSLVVGWWIQIICGALSDQSHLGKLLRIIHPAYFTDLKNAASDVEWSSGCDRCASVCYQPPSVHAAYDATCSHLSAFNRAVRRACVPTCDRRRRIPNLPPLGEEGRHAEPRSVVWDGTTTWYETSVVIISTVAAPVMPLGLCDCYWHCPHSMPSKVYASVRRPSVGQFVCQRASTAAYSLLTGRRYRSIAARHSGTTGMLWVNAGSATLSSYVGSWTQTYCTYYSRWCVFLWTVIRVWWTIQCMCLSFAAACRFEISTSKIMV